MKVLITIDSLNRGGAETFILDVCRNANRFGIDIMVAAFGGGDLESEFRNGGFEFISLKRKFPVDPGLVFALRRIIIEKEIDIAHGFQPVEALHLYLATRGTRVKCVQTHQGYLKGWKNISTGRFISSKVDANLAVSKSQIPWLQSKLKINTNKNFCVVHNAVDESRLAPTGKDIRSEFGLGKDALFCGMVANFLPTPTKDQMTVCRALAEVLPKHENASFIFVGQVSAGAEEYFERCKSYCEKNGIGDRVIFAGGRTDVPDILDALDVFVFSSLSEGLPVAVIEAMLMRVPIIISDIPPLLEVTDEGACAEVFTPGMYKELAGKMEDLLLDENKRKVSAEKAEMFARRHFTMESQFRTLNKIYSEILNKKRAVT